MTTVAFVVGHEDSRDYPSDTPEAYWRVLVPARKFGSAHILGRRDAAMRALAADVVWIHQPTCFAASTLAESAREQGKAVVCDLSEDPWSRTDVGPGYQDARLDACERALGIANLIVCTSEALAGVLRPWGEVRVVPSAIPLDRAWDPAPPSQPARIAWWSDGRQKRGFEAVAAGLRRVLTETDCRMDHVQFAHHTPLMQGLDSDDARRARAGRLSAYFEEDMNLDAEGNLKVLRDAVRPATLHLECYAPCAYADTVSDVPLLRASALGVPSITTRSQAPPGSLAVAPEDWGDAVLEVLREPGKRQALSIAARSWAESRSTFLPYEAVIKEVTP
jgi:hypothetical protein